MAPVGTNEAEDGEKRRVSERRPGWPPQVPETKAGQLVAKIVTRADGRVGLFRIRGRKTPFGGVNDPFNALALGCRANSPELFVGVSPPLEAR